MFALDACVSHQCPAKSKCRNVPSKGPVCKCNQLIHVLKNNKCTSIDARVFKVKELKFEETYHENYKNKSSEEFQKKAAELEEGLYDTVCTNIIGCIAIRITDILMGSIKVNFDVVTDATVKNISAIAVMNATLQAMADPRLAVFKPNRTYFPQALCKYQRVFLLAQYLFLVAFLTLVKFLLMTRSALKET